MDQACDNYAPKSWLFSNSLILLLLFSQFSAIIFIIILTKAPALGERTSEGTTVSITGADSHSDHSLVPELQQATLELEVDVDMMLTHAHQLLDHDNKRLATWYYLLDQNSRWR